MMKHLSFTILCLLFFVFYSQAQITTSGISGKVTSDKEALIGATVSAIHESSGTKYVTSSNQDGQYSLKGMRTGGPYRIEYSYVGCNKLVYKDIYLKLGENLVLNVTLQPSAELNEVVVSAKKTRFSGEQPVATTQISNRELNTLPTINRTFDDFIRLSPYAGAQSNGYAIGGRDGRMNNITIDGANFNNNMGLAQNGFMPGGGNPISMDAIEEMQVSVAPFDVRQSNFVGAGINAITKSGSNQFRGSAYYYFRNEKTRGNKIEGIDLGDRIPESTTTYGFTLGGPIVKNKLFFFVNAEHEKTDSPVHLWRVSQNGESDPSNFISRVTSADMDAFSSLLRNTYGYNPGSYTNFDGGNLNNRIMARIDWNINRNHTFTTRYNYTKRETDFPVNSTSKPGSPLAFNRVSEYSMAFSNSNYIMGNTIQSLTAELNSNFGNRMSNKLIGTFIKSDDERSSDSNIFPHVDILKDGNPFMTAGYELFSYNNAVNNKAWTITDNFSYITGNHMITTGLSYESQYVSNAFMRYGTGYYLYDSFEQLVNKEAPSLYALTYAYNGVKNPRAELRFGQVSVYAQDEWNAAPNFRLTYGLRIDVPLYLNKLTENKLVSELTFAYGERINTGMWPKSRPLISPRIGFNWDLNESRTITLRGGTGIFTGRIPLVFFTNMPTNGGMIQNTVTINQPSDLAKLAGGIRNGEEVRQLIPEKFPNDPTTLASGAIAGVDRDFRLPQVWKSTLGIDFKLPFLNSELSVEGIYSKDINAVYHYNCNLIELEDSRMKRFEGPDNRYLFPGSRNSSVVNSVWETTLLKNTSKGYSYNMNITYRIRPIDNLSAMISYTWSGAKVISDNPGDQASSAWKNSPAVNTANYSGLQNSQYLTPHRVIASLAYSIPYARNYATHLGVYYYGCNPGNYSYMYDNDMNQDGNSNDLIYVPRTKDEIKFVDKNGYSKEQQEDAFWDFIEQDPYLRNRKGKYAEAYSARLPWVNRFDIRIAQDFHIYTKKQKNTLQLSVNVLNFGNLLNSSWGTIKSNAAGKNGRILHYEGLDENNIPTFSMNTLTKYGKQVLPTESFSRQNMTDNCWQIQLGIKYIFN